MSEFAKSLLASGVVFLLVAIISYALVIFLDVESSVETWVTVVISFLVVLGIAFIGTWLLNRKRKMSSSLFKKTL